MSRTRVAPLSTSTVSKETEVSLSPLGNSSQSTTPTSVDTSPYRWSELVPPQSALTFAAVWDPLDGMVTFSGAKLLSSSEGAPDNKSVDSPSDACSQVLTIDRFAVPTGESTANFARETFTDMSHYFGSSLRPPLMRHQTKPSTTNGGADVYLRGSMVSGPKAFCQYSCFNQLDNDINFDPRTAFSHFDVQEERRFSEEKPFWRSGKHRRGDSKSVTDEGYFEEGPLGVPGDIPIHVHLNLVSRFSTTTTSTSNYVEVNLDEENSSSCWSTLEAPAPYEPSHNHALRRSIGRRLKKRKPTTSTCPEDVLARKSYNHEAPPSISVAGDADKKGLMGFACKLGSVRRKDAADDEKWVCVEVTEEVEVTQKITQRVV